ncbi:MAG: hypothetical protein OEZ02_09090 [Anaerolineae bacterium]|nr:hypothetical protein [Anaerolineae bacterium]
MVKRTQDLHKEAKKIIIQYALFRWENAVVLAGVIILTAFFRKPFLWWPVWGWPFLGLLGVGSIFLSSLTNKEKNARLLLLSYQEKFDLNEIKLPELRGEVETALEYQRRVDTYLWQQDNSPIWDRADDTANQIQNWISNVYQLARHLDVYRRDKLMEQELNELPEEIASLKKQRDNEKDGALLAEFGMVLESKEKQLGTLKTLDSRMKKAELQLEHSLSALATVDSQIRLIAAQDVDRGRSDRLSEEIQEQVNRLGDLIDSIQEVYEVS